jgi:Spy/CpxP family protein refolding chaperone
MKKFVVIALFGVLGLGVLGAAAARQGDNWRQRRANFFAQHFVHELNLSDAQRESIKAILQKEKPAIQSIANELQAEHAQLRSKPTFDEAFVRSVAQQRSATLENALVEREKVRSEIFAVLNADQQQKVDHLAEEIRTTIQERIATLGDQL